mmetsp:Transcript_52149/g.100833  ORF Transcript_52149/g.100833 Transcript_52149/m.100833 type:complete len:90 (+) Transcript_52149:54-323(+)
MAVDLYCAGFMNQGLITGTIVWAVVGFIAYMLAKKYFVKEYPKVTLEESEQLATVVVWTSTICMWLFWSFVYMHQMVPLMYPIHDKVSA